MNDRNDTASENVQHNSPNITTLNYKPLTAIMQMRHSTRSFLPTPVPHQLLQDVLSLAQNTPSNSNLQPWRIKLVTGNALHRVSSALVDAVRSGLVPTTAPIPESYRHYRSALGAQLYGPDGYDIARSDKEGMEKARMRNYAFFDAPVGMIVYMDRRLADADVLCVGMYVETLCLLLAERGLATCVQVSVAGYPDVIKRELGVAEDMLVLTGVAVGFEDEAAKLNKLRAGRDAWKECVEFIE